MPMASNSSNPNPRSKKRNRSTYAVAFALFVACVQLCPAASPARAESGEQIKPVERFVKGTSSESLANSPTGVPGAASTAVGGQKESHAMEAERLYNEALEFYLVERWARAFDLGQECCALAPQNARYRAALAVFAAKDRPLIYSLEAAKGASRIAPHDANAMTNLAIMFQKNGQRVEAVDRYKKAEAMSNKDYRPRLGIAQCLCIDGNDGLAIAEQELQAAVDTPEDSVAKWSSLGMTYFTLRQNASATACFKKALKIEPQNYWLQTWRLKCALAEHDVPTIKALVPDVVCDKLADPEIALALALLPDNDFSPDLKDRLLHICEKNLFANAPFFYQLGRNLEVVSHLDRAYEAYQVALKAAPGECQYIVSEIGNRLAAGRNDEAFAVWGQSSAERNKPLLPGMVLRDKGPFAHVLDCVGALLQSDSSGVHITRVKFKNIKCGCRIPVMQMKMTIEPGVVFAHIEDAKEYPAVVVYDAKKTSPETIFKHVRHEDDVIEVLSDSPVQSIPDLVRLVQAASDKPDKHIYSLWSFVPPPMELPK
jgi:tetratricopeptide (TPR) repeat protein